MKEKTLFYYRQGYNCSQCILKAAEQIYRIPISKNSMDMCCGVTGGFGIGGMCSVLIAGIMVFGLLFDKNAVKSMRVQLLDEFNGKYGDLNCGCLKKHRKAGYMCEEIVGDIAEMVEKIIAERT